MACYSALGHATGVSLTPMESVKRRVKNSNIFHKLYSELLVNIF